MMCSETLRPVCPDLMCLATWHTTEPEDFFYCPLVDESSMCVSTCFHVHQTSVRGELWPLGGAADETSSSGHRRSQHKREFTQTPEVR